MPKTKVALTIDADLLDAAALAKREREILDILYRRGRATGRFVMVLQNSQC